MFILGVIWSYFINLMIINNNNNNTVVLAKAEVLAALYGRLNLNLEPTPQPSSPDVLSLTISNSRVHSLILL